jgi:hypothetical protein
MNMQRLVLPSKQRCHFNNARVIVIGKKRKKKTRRKVKEQKKKIIDRTFKNIYLKQC